MKDDTKFAFWLIIFILLVGGVALYTLMATWWAIMVIGTPTIRVTEKVGAHGESGIYLIFADNLNPDGTPTGISAEYTVEDNWFKGKFDASTRYHNLEVGHKYQCNTTGIRYQLFSFYPNLIECTELGV